VTAESNWPQSFKERAVAAEETATVLMFRKLGNTARAFHTSPNPSPNPNPDPDPNPDPNTNTNLNPNPDPNTNLNPQPQPSPGARFPQYRD
tara:strand:- start:339 stop:611 length:273 start_codon:yes stop_codon:yes gene_type:complete